MHLVAQTPRFFIRQFIQADENTYLTLFDDKDVTTHLPKRSQHENVQMFKDSLEEYAAGKVLGRWGMFNNGTEEFIGICLLREYTEDKSKVELGYVLRKTFWGKGIASEMAQILVAYAFTHTDIQELVAVTTLQNTSSQKVLEKAGFERQVNIKRDKAELAFFTLKKGV